ncbi:YybH family protein [Leifsonia poae]|uniref:YybH family protein n=1 Tax=Leifsonia poae TaxID=110933 RepID=UPI001CBD1A3A|nr:nuclear transport factor 2 family protein [Leifsonia poae]
MTSPDPDLEHFLLTLYRNLGDRAAFDASLDPELTVWESADPRLLRGLGELDELRGPAVPVAERTSPLPHVRPVDLVTESWGDTGLIRAVLEVRDDEHGPVIERVRMTDVVRRSADGRWRIVHHHAQDLAGDGDRDDEE